MRFLAKDAGNLMIPIPPAPLRAGQGRRMDDMLRLWPGLFKITLVSLILMAIAVATHTVQHAGRHITTVQVSK